MSTKPQLELFLENENGTQQVAYPLVEADHVSLSNGMDIDTMIAQDVSMPTVAHEDLSFKVGVGDQDVSSAIVDGSVAEMAIKGQTYQNILPEPSLRNSMTNGKTMQKINEGYDSVEVVDGVGKSAILSGQTLVNLATKTRAMGSTAQFNKDTITLTTNTDKPWFSTTLKTVGMKAGGTYLLYTDSITYDASLSSSSNLSALVSLYEMNPNRNVGKFISNGTVKVTIPSDVDASDIGIRIHATLEEGTGGVGKTTTVKGLMIFEYVEGMENWDIPYIEGMASCKMPVLSSVGKNLLQTQPTLSVGSINPSTGEELNQYTNESRTGYIDVSKLPYPFKMSHGCVGEDTRYGANVRWYDDNKTFLGSHADPTKQDYFNKIKYARFVLYKPKDTICNIQIEHGTSFSSYEPYKTNILSCNEEVELRGIGDVKDTLNCLTGELTQRIGEIVLDGGTITYTSNANYLSNTSTAVLLGGSGNYKYHNEKMCCDSLPSYSSKDAIWGKDANMEVGVSMVNFANPFCVRLPHSVTGVLTTDDESVVKQKFQAYLQTNPITVQYELETPIIKTVDLSSSGNWEKVMLNGSENWARHGNYGSVTRFNVTISNMAIEHHHVFSDKFPRGAISTNDLECVNNHYSANQFQLQIKTSRLTSDSVDGLKQYLSQNPLTIWYQAATHKDSTQVKQPIFFKDGHIQLSSGADNSLIPTLDYQAKTSNSYVMDLMKTNTRYTMKAKSASGTFTIDGTSYGAGTNGTFTTPSSMTNKLLVMSNKTNEEVMILEGDMVSKAIPYFKGIKSAFEDESKIEVLSTGKNLIPKPLQTVANLDVNGSKCNMNEDGVFTITGTATRNGGRLILGVDNNLIKPFELLKGRTYTLSLTVENDVTNGVIPKFWLSESTGNNAAIVGVGGSWAVDSLTAQVTPTSNIKVILGYNVVKDETYNATFKVQLEESSTQTSYEPYKSNSTKIPLLSSLQTVVENVHMTQGSLDNTTGAELVDTTCVRSNFIEVVEDTAIVFRNGGLERMAHILAYDSEKRYIEKLGIVSSCSIPKDRGIKYVRIFMNMSNYDKLKISKSVKAYKGLASLPNGVRDEIILDRENNKAKIIQRVGKVTYDGTDVWGAYTVHQNNVRIQTTLPNCVRRDTAGFIYAICDKLPSVVWNYSWLQNYNLVTVNLTNLHLQLSDTTMTKQQMLSWLTQNPITVQYELAEPVVTEVDLSGFPYIYKEGHIFLNGEIASVTEIKYSINQSHMIEASNQDLIRHQKEIDYLYKLIGEYVRVDYKNTLLSLNLELK